MTDDPNGRCDECGGLLGLGAEGDLCAECYEEQCAKEREAQGPQTRQEYLETRGGWPV